MRMLSRKNLKRSTKIAIDINATVGAVNSAIRWLGIETRKSREAYSLKFPKGRFGKDSPRWKGGRIKTSKGYIYIYVCLLVLFVFLSLVFVFRLILIE